MWVKVELLGCNKTEWLEGTRQQAPKRTEGDTVLECEEASTVRREQNFKEAGDGHSLPREKVGYS